MLFANSIKKMLPQITKRTRRFTLIIHNDATCIVFIKDQEFFPYFPKEILKHLEFCKRQYLNNHNAVNIYFSYAKLGVGSNTYKTN